MVLGILLLSTFPGWHQEIDDDGSEREVKPFPSRAVSQVALFFFFASFVIITLTAIWQHAVAGSIVTSLEYSTYGAMKPHIGVVGIVFGWLACLFSFIVVLGLLIMILSINVLRDRTEEEEQAQGEVVQDRRTSPPPSVGVGSTGR